MTKRRSAHQRAHSGFTITELLVVVALSSVIILAMFSVLRSGSLGYRNTTARIDGLVEARSALHVFTEDAASAIRQDHFNLEENEGEINLGYLTLKPLDAQLEDEANGDLCYIQYFTAIHQEFPGTLPSRKLFRRLISSSQVAETLLNEGEMALPTPDPEADGVEMVAFNVIDFNVAAFAPAPANEDANAANALVEWSDGGADPLVLELDLLVLDDEKANAFRTEADWKLQTPLARQLVGTMNSGDTRHGRRFQIKIPFGYESQQAQNTPNGTPE